MHNKQLIEFLDINLAKLKINSADEQLKQFILDLVKGAKAKGIDPAIVNGLVADPFNHCKTFTDFADRFSAWYREMTRNSRQYVEDFDANERDAIAYIMQQIKRNR